MRKPLLKIENVYKEFPGVKALQGVDFILEKGSVVSLVGTNGAGKSTLSNIIAGIFEQDDGDIYVEGEKVRIPNPKEAENLGIAMVHQEPTLVPDMTVTQNLFLNKEITRGSLALDFKKMEEQSLSILDRLGYHIDVNRKAETLTLVEKEVVEIAKAMLLNPRILILDEVTAPLSKPEVEHLFLVIEQLKEQGIGIVFISHKIKEVIQISDKVVVFRDGNNVGELEATDKLSEREIISLMLGEIIEENLEDYYDEMPGNNKAELLKVVNLFKKGYFSDINFTLLQGEIIGFAGLKGSGITELFKSIQGIDSFDEGELFVKGKIAQFRNPKQGINSGVGMITNDRQKENLALGLDVKENIAITSLEYFLNRLKIIKNGLVKGKSEDYCHYLSIKTPSISQIVENLSGGNQQKIVVAKCLLRNLDVIIIDEPTRGVDVKAKAEIYKLLLEQKKNQKGLLIASPELRELLDTCDRIFVVMAGKIIQEIKRDNENFNEKDIMEIMHSA